MSVALSALSDDAVEQLFVSLCGGKGGTARASVCPGGVRAHGHAAVSALRRASDGRTACCTVDGALQLDAIVSAP
jgi:hypothetical protein